MPVELDVVPGQGTLQLRDALPHTLASPTRITGSADDQTGNLSGLALSTPQVVIERDITSPLNAHVTIEAAFSQVAPGAGVVDPDGNVTIELSLAVDLHIEVVPNGSSTPIELPGDCRAAPIGLTLTSTAPYDLESERVTVTAGDFTVPEVPFDAPCDGQIGGQVNTELAGSGHSLSLLLEGALPVPEPVGCETTTELVVDPAGSSSLGAPLAFTATTATVVEDAECAQAATDGLVLSGAVDFFRDGAIIGSAVLDGAGEATFSTSGLPAGNQQMSARFRGNLPFKRSVSEPVAHRITTQPVVSTDLPEFIRLGEATEFSYTVTNSQYGADLDDVRVDITTNTFATVPVLERWDGTTWQPVPLTLDLPRRFAALPAFDLARGTEHTERLRITGTTPVPGQVVVTFEVKPDTALPAPEPSANVLGRGGATTTFFGEERIDAQIQAFFLEPVAPHTVRQGATITVEPLHLVPGVIGHTPRGYFEYFIDGQLVPVGIAVSAIRPGEERTRVPAVNGAAGVAMIQLPSDARTGLREVTVRYSGDAVLKSTQVTWPFYVVPARGPSYTCFSEGIPPMRWGVNVEALANVPSSAPAGEVDLGNLDVTILGDRSPTNVYALFGMVNDDGPTAVGEMALRDLRFTFSGGGTGTATGFTRSNGWELDSDPRPAPDPDHVIAFDDEEGTTTIAGAVGDIVPVTLETIEIDLVTLDIGVPYNFVCTPIDDPVLLGEVRVAGVDLTVNTEDPEEPVRTGDTVTLTADTGNPTGAGVVEFRDGTTTIGVVSVVGGVAAMATDELPVGNRSLTARYYPQPAAPMLVSAAVPLVVLPAIDCDTFAEEGDGAVVRLVYLELLGRCPDQAGFDYWTDRLDAGTSPETFARSIARTPEAVGRVVDDAYRTVLGRSADAEGRAFWVGRMRTGSGRYDQLLADLASSSEFWAKAGSTRAGFVTRVYEQLLDRAPDGAGLEFWTDRLAAGVSRHALVVSLANQPEPLGRLVAAAYDEILGRAPVGSEPANASSFLRTTGDRSGLYAELIGSAEFFDRAQDFPNPED